MPEYFELTFFLDKKTAQKKQAKKHIPEILGFNLGENQIEEHEFDIFTHKTVLLDIFEESDFFEYRICLSDVIFTKRNFQKKLAQILEVVDECFSKIESILFATGIYELTYYYIEGISYIKEFNKTIFLNFPFLFFRKGNEFGFSKIQQYGEISYVLQIREENQNVFANPITELIEDKTDEDRQMGTYMI